MCINFWKSIDFILSLKRFSVPEEQEIIQYQRNVRLMLALQTVFLIITYANMDRFLRFISMADLF